MSEHPGSARLPRTRSHPAGLRAVWATGVVALLFVLGASGAAGRGRTPRPPHESAEVERLHLDDVRVVSGERPVVELYVRAETRDGVPVHALAPAELSVRDNGREIAREQVEIAPLAETDRGAAFVFALDASAKVRGAAFERAKSAVLSALEQMRPNDRIGVVAFTDRVATIVSLDTSRNESRKRIEALEADPTVRTTLVFDGAFRAVQMIRTVSGLPRRRQVVVFSDGRDDGSAATLIDVVDLANGKGALGRIPVFTIGFDPFGSGDPRALAKLALDTAGEPFFPQSSDLIASYFDRVWRRVQDSYLIRYPARHDGGHHSIEVAIGRQTDTKSVAFPAAATGVGWQWPAATAALVGALGFAYWRRSGRAGRLYFLDGPRKGESIPIAQSFVSLGALPDNDIVISAPEVSRYHAQLRRRGRRVLVMDVGSANGTFVNGTAIKQCALEPGDLIQIGGIEIAYDR